MSTPPTPPPSVDEAKERLEDARIINTASEGPWWWPENSGSGCSFFDAVSLNGAGYEIFTAEKYSSDDCYVGFQKEEDAFFIARARTRWPECIAARDAAEAEVERLSKELAEATRWIPMSEPPAHGSKILVLSKYGSIDTAMVIYGWLKNGNWHYDVPIGTWYTHWMQQPPVPGEKP